MTMDDWMSKAAEILFAVIFSPITPPPSAADIDTGRNTAAISSKKNDFFIIITPHISMDWQRKIFAALPAKK
jgi:hypothetical protein